MLQCSSITAITTTVNNNNNSCFCYSCLFRIFFVVNVTAILKAGKLKLHRFETMLTGKSAIYRSVTALQLRSATSSACWSFFRHGRTSNVGSVVLIDTLLASPSRSSLQKAILDGKYWRLCSDWNNMKGCTSCAPSRVKIDQDTICSCTTTTTVAPN